MVGSQSRAPRRRPQQEQIVNRRAARTINAYRVRGHLTRTSIRPCERQSHPDLDSKRTADDRDLDAPHQGRTGGHESSTREILDICGALTAERSARISPHPEQEQKEGSANASARFVDPNRSRLSAQATARKVIAPNSSSVACTEVFGREAFIARRLRDDHPAPASTHRKRGGARRRRHHARHGASRASECAG